MSVDPIRVRRIGAICVGVLLMTGAFGCAAKKHHTKIAKDAEALRYDLAALYVKKGAKQAAIPLLQNILRDHPKDVRARIMYGSVLRDLGLYPQARRELHYALKLAPKAAAAHAALGMLYDLKKQSKRARKYHIRSVQLARNNATYRNNLGFSLFLAGKTKAAVVQLEQALRMNPGLVIAYNNLGFAYGQLTNSARAKRTCRAALSEASTPVNMALVYECNGDLSQARALRQDAYKLTPDLRPDDEDTDL